MSEQNYEAIGRCVVMRKRIEENICALHKIKSEIISADSPFLLDGRLCGSHSLVLSIETNANRCRELLDETMQLVNEHNQHAAAAGMNEIHVIPERETL
ncbi:TPA: hypothetical protein JLG26_003727 [Escherichia coli]|nr:hypothetical protein [Escherichia coli]